MCDKEIYFLKTLQKFSKKPSDLSEEKVKAIYGKIEEYWKKDVELYQTGDHIQNIF